MTVKSLERDIETMHFTARERVLGDPDMLDIIFSYLDPQSVKTVRLVSTSVKKLKTTVLLTLAFCFLFTQNSQYIQFEKIVNSALLQTLEICQ